MELKKVQDPYLTLTKGIHPRFGFSVLDEFRCTGGKRLLRRTYEQIRDETSTTFSRDPGEILCNGAAIGLDQRDIARHFWAAANLKFVGFLIANIETPGGAKAICKTRGSIVLTLPDVTEANQGAKVYVQAPNEFTLSESAGAAEIGKIRYVQRPHAAIFFRAYNDECPLNLSIRRDGRVRSSFK